MKNFLNTRCLVIFTLAILLVSVQPVLANDTRGNIAMIDPDNHTFTLVDENNNVLQMRFMVGGQVLLNDHAATIWDLSPGDRVHVTYDRGIGQMNATAIECRRIH